MKNLHATILYTTYWVHNPHHDRVTDSAFNRDGWGWVYYDKLLNNSPHRKIIFSALIFLNQKIKLERKPINIFTELSVAA